MDNIGFGWHSGLMGWARGAMMVGGILCGAAVAVPAWGCVAVTAPYLNALDPNAGPAGTVVAASGGRWSPNQHVTLSWARTGQHLGSVIPVADGNFSTSITIPSDAVSGSIQYVQATQGDHRVSTAFSVEASSSTSSTTSPPGVTSDSGSGSSGDPGSSPAPAGSSDVATPPPDSPSSGGGTSAEAASLSGGGSPPAPPSGTVAGTGTPRAAGTAKPGSASAAPGAPAVAAPILDGTGAPGSALPEALPTDGDQEQARTAGSPPTASAHRTDAADRKNTTKSSSVGPLGLVLVAAGVAGSVGAGAVSSQHRRRKKLSPPN